MVGDGKQPYITFIKIEEKIFCKSDESAIRRPCQISDTPQIIGIWHAFDFVSGLRPDGTYEMQTDPIGRAPADAIILNGAYSGSAPLADLVDLSVLVDVPLDVRHARLAAREETDFLAHWHSRWDAVEEYYFTQVRPKTSFDLVVSGG